MTEEVIHLNREQLRQYVHLGAVVRLDDLEQDDPAVAHIIGQLGLFFAANLKMADYAIDIEKMILRPQHNGKPPLVKLWVTRKKRAYRLETASDGRLPPLPFGPKWRKRQ